MPNAPGADPGRRSGAVPDRLDLRDWIYQPPVTPLAPAVVNCQRVPAVLDQRDDWTCCGFALAAVVNYLLREQRGEPAFRVSPRMLYEMARRYDAWPGESYHGSSTRGALKGWLAHGVCREERWPARLEGVAHFDRGVADDAREVPGGAYLRVDHRRLRDVQAAIQDAGILLCSIMIHEGWEALSPGTGSRPVRVPVEWSEAGERRCHMLPVLHRRGRAGTCHAVALVGYDHLGLVVQNSWGETWGEGGFALLPYEDFLLHAVDVWVVQLGVPMSVDAWRANRWADTAAGLFRARPCLPLAEIRPYVLDVGEDGDLSYHGDYWTTESDVRRLFARDIPEQTGGWEKRRILLYVDGGLEGEEEMAHQLIAHRDVLLANQVYPLHILWQRGLWATFESLLQEDEAPDGRGAAGGPAPEWFRRFRGHLVEARDQSLELTAAKRGRRLWAELRETARLASQRYPGRRREPAVACLCRVARESIAAMSEAHRAGFEIHLVAHSTGSLVAAYALRHLVRLGVPLASVHLLAPTLPADLFARRVLRQVDAGRCPLPVLYVLSDAAECRDSVGPYGRSLLYLASNAFEECRGTPLLGMEAALRPVEGATVRPHPTLARHYASSSQEPPPLVVAGEHLPAAVLDRDEDRCTRPPGERWRWPAVSGAATHAGFARDPWTLNALLYRVLGRPPEREFTTRDLRG
ncbi:MAG TPA: C1 family peptidase [Thermoanaerobaculia bacterium]|nr:C1 family peptidase [Thermoanaerobaculia bacterium]